MTDGFFEVTLTSSNFGASFGHCKRSKIYIYWRIIPRICDRILTTNTVIPFLNFAALWFCLTLPSVSVYTQYSLREVVDNRRPDSVIPTFSPWGRHRRWCWCRMRICNKLRKPLFAGLFPIVLLLWRIVSRIFHSLGIIPHMFSGFRLQRSISI